MAFSHYGFLKYMIGGRTFFLAADDLIDLQTMPPFFVEVLEAPLYAIQDGFNMFGVLVLEVPATEHLGEWLQTSANCSVEYRTSVKQEIHRISRVFDIRVSSLVHSLSCVGSKGLIDKSIPQRE